MSTDFVAQRISDLKTLKNRLNAIDGGLSCTGNDFELHIRANARSGELTIAGIDKEIALEWMQSQKIKLQTEIKNLGDAINHCAEILGYEKFDPDKF